MLLHWEQDAHFAAAVIANSLEGALLRVSRAIRSYAFSLACSAAAPSHLRHALSSVRLLMLLHWEQDAHFAAVVIANSLEGTLLRVSLSALSCEQIYPSKLDKEVNQNCVRYQYFQ